jgi:CRISPR-associated protein Csx14
LHNPGQVLASLGFLEAACVLCSGARGGFDWSNANDVRFVLHANGDDNPFARVLEFLAKAKLNRIAPINYRDPTKQEKGTQEAKHPEADVSSNDLLPSDCFAGRVPDPMTLPIRLTLADRSVDVSHWADDSSRNTFKLFAGNRSAASIARAMLTGTREKPRTGQDFGKLKTKGLKSLWEKNPGDLTQRPFDVLTPMGGSFNFDPRGAWTPLEAGYSPDVQKHGVAASPVVEILAAIGLEHARPAVDQGEKGRLVRYAAWGEPLSPLLARPALAGCRFGVPLRTFRFEFALSGKNKVVNFAEWES